MVAAVATHPWPERPPRKAARIGRRAVEGQFDPRDRVAVRRQSRLIREHGDRPCELDVAISDAARVVTGEPNVDVAVTQVEVRVVAHSFGSCADRIDQSQAGPESAMWIRVCNPPSRLAEPSGAVSAI